MKDHKNMLQYDMKNEKLYVNFENFWHILYCKFHLSHIEIEKIVKNIVEEQYKLTIKFTDYMDIYRVSLAEDRYRI